MARFFFHVKNGDTFKDEEGEECSGLEVAQARAARIACELLEAGGYEGLAVVVTDEQGKEVAHVLIGGAAN